MFAHNNGLWGLEVSGTKRPLGPPSPCGGQEWDGVSAWRGRTPWRSDGGEAVSWEHHPRIRSFPSVRRQGSPAVCSGHQFPRCHSGGIPPGTSLPETSLGLQTPRLRLTFPLTLCLFYLTHSFCFLGQPVCLSMSLSLPLPACVPSRSRSHGHSHHPPCRPIGLRWS